MPGNFVTPLDVAAQVDRVLRRNIQWPLKNLVFADSPVTVTDLDRSSMCNAIGGAIVVNLPDATLNKGMFFEIKKTDISVNTVTVMCTVGGQTIDGVGAKVLVAQNDFIVVESDGANYKIVALNISTPGGGGAVFYTVKKIVKTDGVGAYVPIPGTLIPFTVAVAGECSFWAAGTWSGIAAVCSGSLNFRVDGVDYAPETFALNNGAGGDFVADMALSPHISLFLTAGPHTVELVGSAVVLGLNASPAVPLTLSVLFPAASFSTAAPTPKAATFVVHSVPGVGDFTTIAAALAALIPLGGGYILAREGSYVENLVFPNVPVVLRGCGDNTILALGVAPGSAFSVSVDQPIVIEDMQVLGDGVAAQIVLDIPAVVTGSKKIVLNRVNSYSSVKTIVSNAGATTPLIEIKSSNLQGATAGWASAGGGTVILTDLAGTFGAVTGATTGTLITRNAALGTITVSAASVIEGAKRADSTGSTTAVFVTLFTHTNPRGLLGIGTIKNTDGANTLTARETVTDAFGTTTSVSTDVLPGASYLLDPQTFFGTARPPYLSYAVAVIDKVAASHATFELHHLSQGAL
jgi:hypothetical protein